MRAAASTRTTRCIHGVLAGVCSAALISALAPAASQAAFSTFGSPLSVPATLNTTENLAYQGTNTAVPPSAEFPSGNVHTSHFGADTALWNVSLGRGQASAPAAGQAVKVSLEGCAQAAAGGPPPLTQIHFQSISPIPGGGAKVNLSSQPYEIPVCGQNGAGDTTVTSYEPINLCVNEGDYIDVNDEGGFVEHFYRSGVPYQIFGAVRGSTFDSFIKGDGTGNGATLSAMETSAMEGFASNPGEELMLRVTLGTGKDATPACGGTLGVPPPLAPMRVSPQTDGVNHRGYVSVALFCRVSPECKGTATLSAPDGRIYGRSGFSLTPERTVHLPIHVSSQLVNLIRKDHGVSTVLTAALGSQTITQTITVKIF